MNEFEITEFEKNELAELKMADLVSDRRKEQFDLRLRGLKRREILDKLKTKYDVSEKVLDQDWYRRKDWLFEVIGATDVVGLVSTTIGSFGISQSFRRDLFETLSALSNKISDSKKDQDVLPAVWGMMMKLLNDIDASEKTKSDILTKLGILREAPKKVEVQETKVEHKIDWTKVVEEMDDDTRRKFFDVIGESGSLGVIDINGDIIEND